MHSIKTKSLLWASLCAVFALGACGVDTNPAKGGGDDDDDGTPPCGLGADGKAIKQVSIEVFGAATGTPTLYPENKPPKVPDIVLSIPDKDGKPEDIATVTEGSLTTADFCPGKPYEVTAWLGESGDAANKLGTLAATPSVDAKKPFILVTGGLIKATAAERHHIPNVAFSLFAVDTSTFSDADAASQIIVVHASSLLGEPAVVDVGAKTAAATLTKRFTASAPIDLAVDDATASDMPKAVKVKFTSGAESKAVTIGPRFPKGTKAVAILFDTLDNDEMVTGKDIPDPSSQLYLTADDPLLSALPATGVTFPVEE